MRHTYYHVTDCRNLSSIMRKGLRPEYAIGRLKAVWVCDFLSIPWAMAHVAKRHAVTPWNLVVLRVEIDRETLARKTGGLFWRKAGIETHEIKATFALIQQ